jgi:hypothetical protein
MVAREAQPPLSSAGRGAWDITRGARRLAAVWRQHPRRPGELEAIIRRGLAGKLVILFPPLAWRRAGGDIAELPARWSAPCDGAEAAGLVLPRTRAGTYAGGDSPRMERIGGHQVFRCGRLDVRDRARRCRRRSARSIDASLSATRGRPVGRRTVTTLCRNATSISAGGESGRAAPEAVEQRNQQGGSGGYNLERGPSAADLHQPRARGCGPRLGVQGAHRTHLRARDCRRRLLVRRVAGGWHPGRDALAGVDPRQGRCIVSHSAWSGAHPEPPVMRAERSRA